ncbi:MAG: cytochrome c [Acidobacteriota bacterium]|nr:cytochrome c [Acidobacteriota bacterium]
MKSAAIGFVLIAFVLFAIACNDSGNQTSNQNQTSVTASPASTATPDALATAKANFEKHCSACHGKDGTGGLVTIEDKKLKVPSLREGHALKHTDVQLAKQIRDGAEEMPAFKDKVSAAEINDLVTLIRKEFQGRE